MCAAVRARTAVEEDNFHIIIDIKESGRNCQIGENLVLSNFVEVVKYKHGLAENLEHDCKFFSE